MLLLDFWKRKELAIGLKVNIVGINNMNLTQEQKELTNFIFIKSNIKWLGSRSI